MAIVSYKFTVRPSKEQVCALKKQIRLCHALQWQLLDYCFEQLRKGEPVPTHYTLCNMLPQLKTTAPDLREVNSQVLQNVARRVSLAMRRVITRNATLEESKKLLAVSSLTYPQYGKGCRLTDTTLYLDKVGSFTLKDTKRITGTLKTLTITRSKTNRWSVAFSSSVNEMNKVPQKNVVGIDFGIKNFVTLSNGTAFSFPKYISDDRKAIATTLKEVRKEKDKTRKNQLQRKLEALRERYRNKLTDYMNKLAAILVRDYDGFCVEDITKTGMRSGPLAAVISAMPWRRFISILKTKCILNGKGFVLVSPVNTSKTCSSCGNIKDKLTLKERTYVCEKCNFTLDRDHNAALVIRARGLESLMGKLSSVSGTKTQA